MNSSLILDSQRELLEQQGIDPDEFALFQFLTNTPEFCHLTIDKKKFLEYLTKKMSGLTNDFIVFTKNTYGQLQWVSNFSLKPNTGLPFKNLLEKAKHEGLFDQVGVMEKGITFNQIYDVATTTLGFYEVNALSLDEMKKDAQKYNFYKELNPCEILSAFFQIRQEIKYDTQYYYFSRDDNNQLCRFCFHKTKENLVYLSISKVRTSHIAIYVPRYVTFAAKPLAA